VTAKAPEPSVAIALGADVAPAGVVTLVARAGARPVAVTDNVDELGGVVRSTQPDAVLIDLALARRTPGGLALFTGAHPGVPVIALCSDETPAQLAVALATGAAGLVRREASPETIGAVIAAAIAGRTAVAPDLVDLALAGATAELRHHAVDAAHCEERAHDLRTALTAPGRLFPVFQPVADLRASRQLGWLALTRFTGSAPEQTGRHFAEARALGLNGELEIAAARAALAQFDRLPADALLFLKASCSTIAAEGFATLLDGPAAVRVVVELSGVADLDDREGFDDAVDRLRHRGVRFAVDETGAGFGPLDQVLDLSPAFVRLAGGLTRGIDTDRTRRALALTVISFASHLGAKVIADQIETAEELDALRRLGVAYGLGFHIGRPRSLPIAPAIPGGPSAAGPSLDAEHAAPAAAPERVLWARSGRDLGLPRRAQTSFAATSTAVLRLVGERLDDAVGYVGLLDHQAEVTRIVDVGPGASGDLDVGASFPLERSVDALAATGQTPQLAIAPGGASGLLVPAAAQWAVVPFAGTAEQPLATLTAVSRSAALDDTALTLLRDAAGALAAALEREHGSDAETVSVALREQAGRDRFTGLLNAHRFRAVLDGAHARAVAAGGLTFVVALTVTNLDALVERHGHAVGGLVLKDVARSLALEAEQVDALGRVGPTTYGCVLFGRRASEVDYFRRSVMDRVVASGRRRGATIDLRTGVERLGLRASGDDAWQAAIDRLFST
jgi:EAL domain-containing protein (putative c-di-GMP-specific phosphodiesterase class I)/GGDEF domain-containing protein/DNA-binding NarL/FixJ family response regulator